jgi:hypothetical protein
VCERLSILPAAAAGREATIAVWLVEDGCEPNRVPGLVLSGVMQNSDTVWLCLDVRETDWRRAATELRSAFWTAAWQGLAGVAVRCEPPSRQVDRQAVIWHILRDARQDVALWRQARSALQEQAALAQQPDEKSRRMARLAALDRIVGTDASCDLVLRLERRPFRRLYGLAAGGADQPGEAAGPDLAQFEAARGKVISLLSEARTLYPAASAERIFWNGIALTDPPAANGSAGPVRWAIVAADGEAPWKTAVALQQALQQASARSVSLSRTFPALSTDPPRLIWLVASGQPRLDWPESVRQAVLRGSVAELVTVSPKQGVTVAILKHGFDMDALLRTFRRGHEVYLTAQHAR